mgnify:CR=1 FL=1
MYIPKFTLVGGRRRIRSVAVAAVNVIALLLVVGCGVTPTVAPGADLPPAPSSAATPPALSDVPDIGPDGRIGCSTTLAFVIGPWKVLRGIDQVPSGPDSANAMGCNFVRGVESVTVVLRGDARELTRTYSLEAPMSTIRFPMEDGAFGILPSDLPLSEYMREVWVTYEGGETEQVPPLSFRPVYVVGNRSDQVPPTPTPWPPATAPNPAGPELVVGIASALRDVMAPWLESFADEHANVVVSYLEEDRLIDRTTAERSAAIYVMDVLVVSVATSERFAAYGAVDSVHGLDLDGASEWTVAVMKDAPHPEEIKLFLEWVGAE